MPWRSRARARSRVRKWHRSLIQWRGGVAAEQMVPVFGRDLLGKAEGNWCKNCKMHSQQVDFEAAAKQSTAVDKVCYFARPPQSCADLERQLAHWFRRLRLASGVSTDPQFDLAPGDLYFSATPHHRSIVTSVGQQPWGWCVHVVR